MGNIAETMQIGS